MSLTTPLAQRYTANNTSATVNTNTSTNMNNIKSIELIQNIPLGNKSLTEGAVNTCLSKSKGRTLVTTRGIGRICENSRNLSLVAFFMPLPKAKLTSGHRNNRVVVVFHMADGTSKTLNSEETVKFWNDTIGTTDSESYRFEVAADFPSDVYTKDMVVQGLKSHRFQSIRVKLNNPEQAFSFSVRKDLEGRDVLVLRPNNAEVNLHAQTVELGSQTIGFTLTEDFFVKESDNNKPDFSSCAATTSSKRREGRRAKAQSNAARISVADKLQQRATVATTTPKVETPVVDAEKEALRKENAKLKAEVQGLKAELANTNAKLDQILAMMAAQAQPVAEPTPVVEEVTPEPVAEPEPQVVEEIPVVEEAEKEAPTQDDLVSEDAFFAGLGRAKAVKSVEEQAAEAEAMFDLGLDDE